MLKASKQKCCWGEAEGNWYTVEKSNSSPWKDCSWGARHFLFAEGISFITCNADMFSLANSLIIKHLAVRICTLASAVRHSSPFCKHASQPSMGGKRTSVLRCPTARPPPSFSGEAKHVFWSQFWLPARGPIGEEGWLTLPSCCPPWIRRFRWASSLCWKSTSAASYSAITAPARGWPVKDATKHA